MVRTATVVYQPGATSARLFLDLSPSAPRSPWAMVRGARLLLSMVGSGPVFAEADPAIPQSARFLSWLGFHPFGGDVFVWRGDGR